MKTALVLLKPRFLSAKNSLAPKSLLMRSPFIVTGIAVWVLLFLGFLHMLRFIKGVGPLGEIISIKLLAMIFFSLTGFLLLSNLITAISAFYLSRDLPLLMAKPVRGEDLMSYKAVEAAVNSSWMVLLFTPTVFLAYGIVYDAPWWFYPFSLLAFVPFLIIPAGAGFALVHVLARIFPVGKTRGALLGLGLVLLLMVYFLIQSAASVNADTLDGLINAAARMRTDSPFLPGFWMTETIAPLLRGEAPDFLFPLLLLTSGAFFLLIAKKAGSRFYMGNIYRLNDSTTKTRKGSGVRCPGKGRAFYWKDMKLFFRDTEQWSQLLIIGALLMVYVYNFKSMPIDAFSWITPFFRDAVTMLNLVLAGLVLTAVSARFLYVAVSLEGGAFWLAKSSPVTMGGFLRNKYMYGFLPITAVMLSLVLLSNLLIGAGLSCIILSLGTILLLSASVTGLATGLGAMYPKFNYESISSVSMGLGSVAFMMLALCLVAVTVALEAWGVYIYKRAELLNQPLAFPEYARIVAAAVSIIALNTLAFLLPLKAGKKRLEGDTGY
jgi:ABC-2 type transport system permease protein